MNDKSQLEELKERFEKISNPLLADNSPLSDNSKIKWKECHDKIIRRFDLFDSNKYFIVATGMLKSGKSTLVNLLARSTDASPIGFGVDTTLRPALIVTENEEMKKGIYIYFPQYGVEYNKEQQDQLDTQLENIIDRIIGLKGKKYDSEQQNVEPVELNQENLRNALCDSAPTSMLAKEPLLVVIVVPRNNQSLLAIQNCAIFDMPGLDSGNSSTNTHTYKKILQECCLILFVQSNVSPLNEKAEGFLSEIGKSVAASTYHLVQNRMDAQNWRDSEIVDNELEEQKKKMVNEFIKATGASKETIDFYSANLGMAYDAILCPNSIKEKTDENIKKVLEDSQYMAFEENLLKHINHNGHNTNYNHNKRQLQNEFSDALNTLKKRQEYIKGNIEEKNNEIKELEDSKNHISKYIDKFEAKDFNTSSLILSEKLKKDLENKLKEKFKEFANDKYIVKRASEGKVINIGKANRLLQNFNKSETKDMIEFLKHANFNDIKYGMVGKKAECSAIELLNEKINEVRNELDNNRIDTHLEGFSTTSETLKEFFPEKMSLKLQGWSFSRNDGNDNMNLFEKLFRKNHKRIYDFFEYFEKEENIRTYIDEIKDELCKVMKGMMADKLNKRIKEYLGDPLDRKNKEYEQAKDERNKLEKEERAIKKINDDIYNLKNAIGRLNV